MSDDNTNLVDIPEDLSSFKDVFLGKAEPAKVEDTESDALANDEGKDAPVETGDEDEVPEDSTEEAEAKTETESDEDNEEDAKTDEEEKEKTRKPSAQKRINELTRLWREEQREKAAILQR